MNYHYLHIISHDSLTIVRVPYPMPLWRLVVKALTPIAHAGGMRAKDIISLDGLFPYPDKRSYEDGSWREEDYVFRERLERAFAGDNTVLLKFDLWEWEGNRTEGRFVLVRPAAGEEER